MTHTPGPWRVGDAGVTVFGPNLGKPSPETIANVRKRDNATLIALAPDMLVVIGELVETLNEALTMLPHIDRNELTALNKAMALLDQAKGGS